jgi:hypothetical protein
LSGYTNLDAIFTTADGAKGPSILPALADGIHHLKLEVEDRAGNVSEDFTLDLLIDTQAYLGTGRLHPASDSGVDGFAETAIDRITRINAPTFFGTAEAGSLVIVRIGGIRSGSGVAIPGDGDDAFQPPNPPNEPIEGNWQIITNRVLDEGEHTVVFTFEDLAGNQASSHSTRLLIDTQGPRVTNVTYGDIRRAGTVIEDEDTTSLFRPKPAGGPDPLISSIVVHISDLPARPSGFDYEALFGPLARQGGNFHLTGDANGNIPILSANPTFFSTPGEAARAEIELVFHDPGDEVLLSDDDRGAPLPDDRFTLTIRDTLTDPAGNRLDGQSGAQAPFTGNNVPDGTPPIFPSGDGAPGGQLVARFTVDSRPEIGIWVPGSVWIDTNGNFHFDPDRTDSVDRDLAYQLGLPRDEIFAGNFAAGARSPADGFDKLAVYGRAGGELRWRVDTDSDGVPDVERSEPANLRGLPVAGRFDGSDINGDEVGLFTGTSWHFDTDHDFQVDTALPSRLVGYPIVGDFDGDGFDDLATWTDNTFQVDLARGVRRGWDGDVDVTFGFGFAGVRERPVAADMDQDGYDDIGLWVPDQDGIAPQDQGQWYVLQSSGASVLDRVAVDADRGIATVPFQPVPLGDDLFARFGDDFASPILGNFDPPVADPPELGPADPPDPGDDNPLDVNRDGYVSPVDALLIANWLSSPGGSSVQDQALGDVNRDGVVSPVDMLMVVQWLNDLAGAGTDSRA